MNEFPTNYTNPPSPEQLTPRVEEVLPELLSEEQIKKIEALYKDAYESRYVGDEWFEESTMKNTSLVALYKQGEDILAAINFNQERMISIAVLFNATNRGAILISFLEELTKTHPHAWITVAIDAPAMLKVMANKRLDFDLINDPAHIQALFQSTQGTDSPVELVMSEETVPGLTPKQAESDIVLPAFSRENSYHGAEYKQLVFQHRVELQDLN